MTPHLIKTEVRKSKKIYGMFAKCFFSLIFCFQKQFSIFENKKLVWQFKRDRKQKLFSKLNL